MTLKPVITKIPTDYGNFWFFGFKIDNQEVLVIATKKNPKNGANIRLHSSCFTSEIFGSLKCDCADQLKEFMILMNKNRRDDYLLIYFLNHEGRGIGLFNKLRAYEAQRKFNLDTYQANEYLGLPHDMRDYSPVIEILRYFNLTKVNLFSNNLTKLEFLKKNGIIVNIKNFFVKPKSQYAFQYLLAKAKKGSYIIKNINLKYSRLN
ncbi:MAG: hypothetical protein KatS3mg097_494 [Candidatus Parcubacteria bacterium]|nr:MAG: hypothetical protein KatS3mg097_494 [Candidatus Parcubacteria bacterium]